MLETILTVAALVIAALVLIFLEIFIPSFGLITAIAAILYAVALWIGYHADPMIMKVTIGLTIPALPLTIWLAFKLLPHSPLVLKARPKEEPEERVRMRELVGRDGVVVTDLHPVGKVMIDGEPFEAISRHGMLEQGARVRVTGVASDRLIVATPSAD